MASGPVLEPGDVHGIWPVYVYVFVFVFVRLACREINTQTSLDVFILIVDARVVHT